jgi:hypothetical protein
MLLSLLRIRFVLNYFNNIDSFSTNRNFPSSANLLEKSITVVPVMHTLAQQGLLLLNVIKAR